VSKDIELHKRNALIVYRLIETLKRFKLANPQIGFYGRNREDGIIKTWRYGKKHGK